MQASSDNRITAVLSPRGEPGLLTSIDLAALAPAFERILRLAEALAGACAAQLTLDCVEGLWSLGDVMAEGPSAPEGVMVWIPDAQARRTEAWPPSGVRFFASLPLVLSDGAVIGALSVVDRRPRLFEAQLADRLADLADLAARECERPLARWTTDLTAPAAPLKVLLAEDHPANRKMTEVILTSIGVELTSVETGQAALEALGQARFDLVLMDLQMPVMDGLTAIRTVRAQEAASGGPRTPIYALTANALAGHIEASRAAGADAHLVKPITAADLIAAVRGVGQAGGPPSQTAPARRRR